MIATSRAERKLQRRRVLVALALSLLFHLLLLVVAIIVLSLDPSWLKPAPVPVEEPVELVIMPSATPTPTPAREFVDSAEAQVTEEAPANAAFESDRNTRAASEQPPQSDTPLPSQAGEDAPGLTLQSRTLSIGPIREPAPPAPASPPRPAVVAPATPAPTPPPTPTPAPTASPQPTATPKPTATPRPTPRPEDEALALLDPEAPPTPTPQPSPPTETARPERPSPPTQPRPPGYQPERRVTRLTGGIDSRGRSSVEAVATPMGRYKKMLSDAIGSRWYYYVNDMLDLVGIGTVQLRFVVRADGRVERIQVLKNTSNESLASCSVRAVMEAEIPPIPKEMVRELAGEQLEVDYSFTIVGRR